MHLLVFRHLPDLHKSRSLYNMSIAFFSKTPFQNIRADKSVAVRAVVARRNACRSLRKLSVSVVLVHASTESEFKTLKKNW